MTDPHPADHPHTDPGDGRQECQPCGKWVFPAIHSCKGVPVTARARARFDAARKPVTVAEQFTPDPADVELVARAEFEYDMGGSDGKRAYAIGWDDTLDFVRREYRRRASAGLAALAGAGRLVPPDADTRPDLWQYGTPDPDEGPDAVIPFVGKPDAILPRHLRRPMRAVGPWVPVPTTKETP